MKNFCKWTLFLLIATFFVIGGFFYKPEVIIDNDKILSAICEREAVFTENDILNEIHEIDKNIRPTPKILADILENGAYIGETETGEKLYTSLKYQRLERATLAKFRKILNDNPHVICSQETITSVLNSYAYLKSEQKAAINGICNSKCNINILIGRAGTGKTIALKAVAEIYKKQRAKVIGMSLSSLAAENLEKIALIESHSIDYWIYYKWICNTGGRPNAGDVMIVDEAGMIGTDHWKKIFNAAERFKMKVIIVGDSNQFKPIAAGDCLRLFTKESPHFELKTIIRQKTAWMREASLEFSGLNIQTAMYMYNVKNRIHESNNIDFTASAKYVDFEKLGNSVILCYTKNECDEINKAVRKIKKTNRELDNNLFEIDGKIFAKNDKIMFLKNHKDFGIKNGQMGIIKGYTDNILEVQTGSERRKINIEDYDKIDYAYAITLHKAQGKTFDNVVIVASPKMDSKAFYVAMTRHRKDAELFYRQSDFSSLDDLIKSASKYNFKNSLEDF